MKVVISGYYGHGNFGDEAILEVIKKDFEGSEIIVLSKIPNFKAIYECDLFISGGGSLLQDVTSLKSLLYYLGLLYLAIILKKKTMLYSQGIGPINSVLGEKLTSFVLKKADQVYVRDQESADFIKELGVDSVVTSDPVWALDYTPSKIEKTGINVGIQLRKWKALSKKKLEILADVINSTFKDQDVVINLISLQDKSDPEVLNNFKEMLDSAQVKIISGLSIEQTIDYLAGMDCLIAMRYHACLISAKYGVPFLSITYDPKVKNLAKELNAPYVTVKDMNKSMLSNALKYIINERDNIREQLLKTASEKAKLALINI